MYPAKVVRVDLGDPDRRYNSSTGRKNFSRKSSTRTTAIYFKYSPIIVYYIYLLYHGLIHATPEVWQGREKALK